MRSPLTTSPLNAIIQADVKEAAQEILVKAINPWIFFNSHGIDIPKVNGKRISIKGIEFSVSACDVFWGGFADEWIQKTGRELIELTRRKAIERGLPVAPALTDCLNEIRLMVATIFNRMAEIEQRLKGKGYPKSVPKTDVSHLIQNNVDELKRIVEAEMKSAEPTQTKTNWWNLLELKPNFCGVGINLNFLIDWLCNKKRPPQSEVVDIQPFLKLASEPGRGIKFAFVLFLKNTGSKTVKNIRLILQHSDTHTVASPPSGDWKHLEKGISQPINPWELEYTKGLNPQEETQIITIPFQEIPTEQVFISLHVSAEDTMPQNWIFQAAPDDLQNNCILPFQPLN